MKKLLLTLSFFALVAMAFVYANKMTPPPPPPTDAYEAAEESYQEMGKSERMEMLTNLKIGYTENGQLKAASYIQGQMDMLESK